MNFHAIYFVFLQGKSKCGTFPRHLILPKSSESMHISNSKIGPQEGLEQNRLVRRKILFPLVLFQIFWIYFTFPSSDASHAKAEGKDNKLLFMSKVNLVLWSQHARLSATRATDQTHASRINVLHHQNIGFFNGVHHWFIRPQVTTSDDSRISRCSHYIFFSSGYKKSFGDAGIFLCW